MTGQGFPLVPPAAHGLRDLLRSWTEGLRWIAATVSLAWPMLDASDKRSVEWAYPLPFLLLHKAGFG